jgi:hypothetical protein
LYSIPLNPGSPHIVVLENNNRLLRNPAGLELTIFIESNVHSRNSIVLLSTTPGFEDWTLIDQSRFGQPLTIVDSAVYFSAIDFPNDWDDLTIRLPNLINSSPLTEIETDSIRSAFVEDVQQFATVWSDNDDQELINLLPSDSLIDSSFTRIKNIAASCSLIDRFSSTVVQMRAFLIYHVNYIKHRWPEKITGSLTSLLSSSLADDFFSPKIECNNNVTSISIDRSKARQFVSSQTGTIEDSIIGQISQTFQQQSINGFKSMKPWSVHFIGEHASDSGGPGRELMNDTAESIFHPTSKLVTQTSNGFFVPFGSHSQELYSAIGVFLGMVIRTGLVQNLPFAPLVWKFIAGESLLKNDFFEADPELEIALQQPQPGLTWICRQWDGQEVPLPKHDGSELVQENEITKYVEMVLSFRRKILLPNLIAMKKGFENNTGLSEKIGMSGRLLSALAQGDSFLNVEDLRSITIMSEYDDNDHPAVERLWRVLSQFTQEQLTLFLKFVTGQGRLPRSPFQRAFRLTISIMAEGDEKLPIAGTCGQILGWPDYSNDMIAAQKLDYAIRNCRTMENL